MSAPHQFTFGVVGRGFSTTSGYQEAMGGLGTTSPGHYGTSYPTPYNMTMIGEGMVDSTNRVLFTLSYTSDGDKSSYIPEVSQYMVNDAIRSGCSPLAGGYPAVPGVSPAEISLFWNDGSTSIALALKDPSGNIQIPVSGEKNNGIPFYVNNFLILDSTQPRHTSSP
jgi:hypothetical protein